MAQNESIPELGQGKERETKGKILAVTAEAQARAHNPHSALWGWHRRHWQLWEFGCEHQTPATGAPLAAGSESQGRGTDIPCATGADTVEHIKCRLNYTGALHWSSSHKRQLCCFVPDLRGSSTRKCFTLYRKLVKSARIN